MLTKTMKTKRKKFMGGSCQVPRKVLEDLSLKHFDRKVLHGSRVLMLQVL